MNAPKTVTAYSKVANQRALVANVLALVKAENLQNLNGEVENI